MKITETLWEKQYSGERLSIPIKDIPTKFLTTENNIMIHIEGAFYTDNNSHDGYTHIIITNYREQTEEEKDAFREHIENLKTERKEERKQQFLKLKEEFKDLL